MFPRIGIVDNNNSLNLITKIYEFIQKKHPVLDDILIFSDRFEDNDKINLAIIPSIYLDFFKGDLIFLDFEQYLEYKENLLSKSISVFIDTNNLPPYIDKKMISTCKEILHMSNQNTIEATSI